MDFAIIIILEAAIWTIFKFPRFSVCIGTFCKQTAVVVLKQCAHGYCFSCLEKLLEQKTEVGPSNLASVKCHRYFCKIMVPTTSINRFFAKLKDKCFRTAVVLEISPVECSKCEVYDRKNVSKARFRNRFCSNEHSFCIDCIVSPSHKVPVPLNASKMRLRMMNKLLVNLIVDARTQHLSDAFIQL
ncbi:uncharacterized protein LOC134250061 [Saccostrea cucullata]|uniref:uncharacterized protein LOC134250061 n=1 Tax=Saccostrea cuccullata TaxID=36930 RepID=UPI002ED2994B